MDPLLTTQYEICPRNPDTLFPVKRYNCITGVEKRLESRSGGRVGGLYDFPGRIVPVRLVEGLH
jgi:hypothetical protein